MSYTHHPSSVIEQELIIRLREQATIAEQEKKLTEEQLNIIYQQHWFKILAPEKYNGLQLSLPDVVQLEEALGWIDGSLGWVVTLCAGAGWFGGFTSPSITEKSSATLKHVYAAAALQVVQPKRTKIVML